MQSFGASAAFLKDEDFEWEVVGEGIKRKIMGYDDQIMMVNVLFEKGAIGTPHEHYHSQVTNVARGSFEVTIDGLSKVMKEGDCFYIPPHVVHGVVCLEDGLLIDVFNPIREDFMQKKTY
ncbi:cupin domain-containing protein [Flavobacterium gilvum]|uniref:Cupin n=1 Tax=Flavobacterium gilvum TaxID=1492737 RepID=A0AAC9N3X7_9FLAO|nr:cupin domain-containing protein [Flavobacterium gilvum]AOW09685.1 cupin [Flavobacterium gilvum]KFC57792.1 cupin [Flavobacterium gilvum]